MVQIFATILISANFPKILLLPLITCYNTAILLSLEMLDRLTINSQFLAEHYFYDTKLCYLPNVIGTFTFTISKGTSEHKESWFFKSKNVYSNKLKFIKENKFVKLLTSTTNHVRSILMVVTRHQLFIIRLKNSRLE